ncbi:MAG TPA: amidohydrolase family protein [Candidatus Binatia bacterium]
MLLRVAQGRVASCTPLAALPADRRAPADALGDPDALLLPALSDAHVHLVACAAEREALDLTRPRPATIAELLTRLVDAARGASPSRWLRATGYDEAWLAEHRHPTRAELDVAVPDVPLRVRHATRHASLLNSLALRRVEQQLGPLGAAHVANAPDGAPLAVVYGLEPEITRVVGPLGEEGILRGLRAVGAELSRHGVVHVDEVTASNDAARVALLARAVESGALPQRVRAYVRDADEVAAAREAAAGRVEIAGVKLLARAEEEARAPAFRDAVARARRLGLAVAVHAVEADVVAAVLDALAAAPPRSSAATRPRAIAATPLRTAAAVPPRSTLEPDRIEHASLCPPELVTRLASAGVAVVTQPAFLAARGDKYRREVEEPLWPWLYPLATLRKAGAHVVAGSDAPVVPLDPRLGLDAAVERRAGDVVLAPEERLDPASALELFTSSAARLRGEAAAPPWTPGAPCDLLVADAWSPRDGFASLRVRATLRAGRCIA